VKNVGHNRFGGEKRSAVVGKQCEALFSHLRGALIYDAFCRKLKILIRDVNNPQSEGCQRRGERFFKKKRASQP
jgi:hypothetical protein